MVCWRHEHEDDAAGLARRAATTRLGAERAGLETARHRRGPGGDRGGGQPMAQTRTRAGGGGTAPPSSAGSAATTDAGAAGADSGAFGSRSGGVRLRSCFGGQIWTCQRVAEVIRRTYGVSYHPAHVSRLLHAVRHRVQRPRTRATQRNRGAIQAWWQERWPALEKKPRKKGAPSSG
jgi:hypothetical protein